MLKHLIQMRSGTAKIQEEKIAPMDTIFLPRRTGNILE
jgi:ABC-type proline/glycine betaine transport system ATPase subunit